MALWVKKDGTSSGWVEANKVWVKDSSTWSAVKKIWVKAATGWALFWPKAGPYTTKAPYFSTDSAGNDEIFSSTVDYGTTIYGQRGTWNANGGTISSYTYKLESSTSPDTGSGPYSTIIDESNMGSSYVTINLNTSDYDGQYLIFTVKATRTDGVFGTDSTDSNGYRLFVMRQEPVSIYAPTISPIDIQITTTALSDGLLKTTGAPITLEYENYWNASELYLPDLYRSEVKWYSSTNGVYSSPSQIIANATEISSGITTLFPTIESNIYTVTSQLYIDTIVDGTYYYAIDTQYNSYTDYYGGTGVSDFKVYGPVNAPPYPTSQPSLSAITPSGYGGNQYSFTVGGTMYTETGNWTPDPSGTYPVVSSLKFSTQSSISNQSNWILFQNAGNDVQYYNLQDQYEGVLRSFEIPSTVYSVSGTPYNLIGNYLEYSVTAINGASSSTLADYYTNAQKVYDVPYQTGSPTLTWDGDNQATVYWLQNLYSSYSYQLEYSLDGSTGWTPVGSMVYTNPNSNAQILYTGLPSGYAYYRVLAYNEDNVWIQSTSTYYNSTPPSYTFNSGDTVYVGTNGYISFENANSAYDITSTVGKVIGFLPNDLIQDYVSYAAVRDLGDDYFLILWQGHFLGQSSTANIKVEFWLQNNQQYAFAKYSITNPLSPVVSRPAGFYDDGVKVSPGSTSIVNGDDINWWFNANSNTLILHDFTYKGNLWSGWYTFSGSSGITSGNTDDGYYTIQTFLPSAPTAPQSVTASSISNSSALISWNAPVNNGSTNYISSYDYSINNGSWISNAGNLSVSITSGLNNNGGSNTVRIRANNESGITSVSYGSVTFNTSSIPPAPTSLTATTTRTDGVKLDWNAVSGANYYEIYWQSSTGSGPVNQSSFADFGSDNSITTNTFIDTTISAGSTRYYRVRARSSSDYNNGANSSDWYPAPANDGVAGSRAYYVVTYNGNGGSTPAAVNVSPGSSTILPLSTRSNYTFNGWYTASSGGTFIGYDASYYTPTASITLYAQWTAISYTVSWDGNGGSVSPSSSSGTAGSTVTAPTPTRSGYTFLYWRDSLSAFSYLYQLSAGQSWTISGNITFYAWWQINQYTVTYNANGGSVSPSSATVNAGSSVTLPTPTRAGYTFNGWYTASSGGSYLGGGGSSYTPGSSITIYAQWTAVTYTITWSPNGGSVSPTSSSGVSGTVVTSPTPTRSGYTFLYWRDSTNPAGYIYQINPGGTWTIDISRTFYAIWQAITPNISSITVAGNGTAGVTVTYVGTNVGSVGYIFYARDTTTSSWIQINSGTTNNTTLVTTNKATPTSVLPDQYYVVLTPYYGTGGTGTVGTARSTIGSPKSNAAGSITVNY